MFTQVPIVTKFMSGLIQRQIRIQAQRQRHSTLQFTLGSMALQNGLMELTTKVYGGKGGKDKIYDK